MSDLRKAAEQALAFLTALDQDDNDRDFLNAPQCYALDRAMKDLRAALAETEQSEPVAWIIDWPDEPDLGHYFSEEKTDAGRCRPLYTHPPRREPLTDEQADEIALDVMGFAVLDKEQAETARMLIRNTEAAHGIKALEEALK